MIVTLALACIIQALLCALFALSEREPKQPTSGHARQPSVVAHRRGTVYRSRMAYVG